MALRQAVRRASTESTPAGPAPKPKRRFRALRITWRLTQIAALAGLGYMGYSIWEMRNPGDQPLPDPSKKTLVILGELSRFS